MDDTPYRQVNLQKELKWLEKVLPWMSEQDRVRVVNGLIEVGRKGEKAWGMFSGGIMTLSDKAAEGTVYHEAFHAVFNTLLDSNEKGGLYSEARRKWGDLDNGQLEERMAEDFRKYVESRQNAGWGKKILNFFKDLFAKVKAWKKVGNTLEDYYRKINSGEYSTTNPIMNTSLEERPVLNRKKETAALQEAFPKLSKENRQRVFYGLVKMLKSRNPSQAMGRFDTGRRVMKEPYFKGMAGHYSFHNILNTLLDRSERNDLYELGAKHYRLDTDTSDSIMDIEAKLANDFRKYIHQGVDPGNEALKEVFDNMNNILT